MCNNKHDKICVRGIAPNPRNGDKSQQAPAPLLLLVMLLLLLLLAVNLDFMVQVLMFFF